MTEHLRFRTLEELVVATAEAVRPPERLTVAQAAEKYRWVNNPGSYIGPYRNDKTPYLVEPMEVLTSTEYNAMVFVGPAQSGKALALDTPLPTPTGWTTMGQVAVGDLLCARDGTPVVVKAVTGVQRNRKCYRVELDDGTSIVADADHKWRVEDRMSRDPVIGQARSKVVTTEEMFRVLAGSKSKRLNRFRLPKTEPLVGALPDPDIDPYLLGWWLAEGDRLTGWLQGHRVPATENLRAAIEERGLPYTERFRSLRAEKPSFEVQGFSAKLRSLGVLGYWRKGEYDPPPTFFPREVLRASEGFRRAVLQGVLDARGKFRGGLYRRVDTTLESSVAKGFMELARSFGYKPRRRDEPDQKKGSWTLHFSLDDPAKGFRVASKRNRKCVGSPRTSQSMQRSIRAIVPVDSVPVKCIQVDAEDSLFLAGESMVPTHNTDMGLNWITYSVICDPADYVHYDKSIAAARDFYNRRLEKLFRDTPEVLKRARPGAHNQAMFATKFTSGMLLNLSWPTPNELAGKPVGRIWIADYDRIDEDIGGEGSAFDLAFQRLKSFRRNGMLAVESSPSRTIESSKWVPQTPHQAPPTTGILALYNRGDRRRWHWVCVSCKHSFEPDFSLMRWPESSDPFEASEGAHMGCPHCGQVYTEAPDPKLGVPGKAEMNLHGIWVPDNCRYDPETGLIEGEKPRSRIASFWLKGPAAAFASWQDMVFKYLKAVEELEATGSEEALKVTVNTDQGLPYLPRAVEADVLPEELRDRAQDYGSEEEPEVPEGVRFLLASVDVQGRSRGRFEVQVHGFGVGGDVWVIDRFKIRKSERLDEDGDPLPLNPAHYVEDWSLLVDKVLLRTYPLADGSGRRMAIRMMTVDSGGAEGVTSNAYEFWRRLRAEGRNLHRRTVLLKGLSTATAPLVKVDYPDAERKDKRAAVRGEVPVMLINTQAVKDMVSNMLGRTEPGGGMVNFPAWLPDWWYSELCAEVRTAKGWTNPGKHRNEAWDLLCYAVALAHSSRIRLPNLDLENNPPSWAAEWDRNDLVSEDETPRFSSEPKPAISLEELANKLA